MITKNEIELVLKKIPEVISQVKYNSNHFIDIDIVLILEVYGIYDILRSSGYIRLERLRPKYVWFYREAVKSFDVKGRLVGKGKIYLKVLYNNIELDERLKSYAYWWHPLDIESRINFLGDIEKKLREDLDNGNYIF